MSSPIRRSADGFLTPQPKPREPALVREQPGRVRLGCELTDGHDGYKVRDAHRRHGSWWVQLENLATGQRAWFSLADCGELAFGRGEMRTSREELQT